MCFLNVFACYLTLNCRLLHPTAPQSTGFGLIYDNIEAAKKFEPKYRLQRVSRRMPNFGGRHVTIYVALVMAEFPPLFMVVWGLAAAVHCAFRLVEHGRRCEGIAGGAGGSRVYIL